MKPIIGLIPLVDEERESLWMLPGYMDGIAEAGGTSVMLPLTADEEALLALLEKCDGLLLTGGHDVSPEVYGAQKLPVCGACSPERDAMEAFLLKSAIAKNCPVLGICRGIQLINAVLGGTLWQDLPTQRPSDVEHHGKPPYHLPVHTVDVFPDTPLADAVGAGTLPVNSYHHQAIRDLAEPLRVMAAAPDGLAEAVWHPGQRFLWAVQWHPEFAHLHDEPSRRIFRAFVDACKNG